MGRVLKKTMAVSRTAPRGRQEGRVSLRQCCVCPTRRELFHLRQHLRCAWNMSNRLKKGTHPVA